MPGGDQALAGLIPFSFGGSHHGVVSLRFLLCRTIQLFHLIADPIGVGAGHALGQGALSFACLRMVNDHVNGVRLGDEQRLLSMEMYMAGRIGSACRFG